MRSMIKSRHRLTILATLIVASIITGLAVFYLGNFGEKRRFTAIVPGMSQEQVLTILGPPGEYGPPGAKYCRARSFC